MPAIHALLRSLPIDFNRLSGLARVKERTKQVAEREVHWGAERMTQSETIVTAWNNGAHHSSGAGYGVKLTTKDRDAYLKREWGRVEIYLPGRANPTKVNVEKDSLWGRQCRELISHEIGKWLLATGMAPWPRGLPPKFRFVARSERAFELRTISNNGPT